jgi:phosphoadenosine phosphosulfate reductase
VATQPGLDPQRLLALRRPHPAVEELPTRIRNHLDTNDGYVAFSGGKDSVVALHLARQADPNVPVAFFDSGLEFPETYRHLEHLRDAWGLNLHWYPARRTTLEVLVDTGAWDHTTARSSGERVDLHQVLITEPAARAHADHGPGEVWGVRAEESRGRTALYATALRAEVAARCNACCSHQNTPQSAQRHRHGGIIRRADHTVAYGPIWDWKTADVWAYHARHQLPVNPAYAKLRRLGAPEHFLRISHMLDGSRLEEGRVTWLRRGWPDLFEELSQVLPRLREFV